jgi:hypothetical protein
MTGQEVRHALKAIIPWSHDIATDCAVSVQINIPRSEHRIRKLNQLGVCGNLNLNS